MADITPLPVAALEVHAANPRAEVGEVEELAASLASQGLLHPLLVTPAGAGTYRLICGSRRLAAARQAGLTTVPCIIRQEVDEAHAHVLALIENAHRQDLDPITEAEALELLIERHRWSQAETARQTGLSTATISRRLRLLELPDPVAAKVAAGTTSIRQALEFLDSKPHQCTECGSHLLDPRQHQCPARTSSRKAQPARRRRRRAPTAQTSTQDPRVAVTGLPEIIELPVAAARTVVAAARDQNIPPGTWLVRAIRAHARQQIRALG